MEFDKDKIIWFAGLFEGEGYAAAHVKERGFVQPVLQIQMTDLDVLEKALDAVPYGRIVGPYKKKDRKDTYVFNVTTKYKVKEVIEAILPHMCSRRRKKLEEVLKHTEYKIKGFNKACV